MAPFSLGEEENRGLEMNGRLTTAGITKGSLQQAGPCDHEDKWCCHVVMRGRSCPYLVCGKKKQGKEAIQEA
ncbi:hypothetical protein DEO72_LG5g2386 [Vigna unguiculata]|uniref:Uncharacterized protein n=1 Tax=Vigna unguiculata TaxID=3917 RepID=A0A4D6M0M7_VIGUN|nr:hypothetical protein DEO72_LG5g2386 [Vigna unguiculata]